MSTYRLHQQTMTRKTSTRPYRPLEEFEHYFGKEPKPEWVFIEKSIINHSDNFKFIELPIERLAEASDLMKRVYIKFNDKDGTEESRKAFIEITSPKMFTKCIKARDNGSKSFNMWICIDEDTDKIVGVLSAYEERLDCLFVDGDYHNRGIAQRLFKIMLEYFNPDEVEVYASLYAAEFYRKLGFVGNDEQAINYGTKVIMMIYNNNGYVVSEYFIEVGL
jgi:GNAT superfamily N-acetyltransferase